MAQLPVPICHRLPNPRKYLLLISIVYMESAFGLGLALRTGRRADKSDAQGKWVGVKQVALTLVSK